MAFRPDGELLATGAKDKTFRLWQRRGETFREVVTLALPAAVVQLAFTPDDKKLAVLVEDEYAIRLWHLDRLQARLEEFRLGWSNGDSQRPDLSATQRDK